MKYKSIFTAGVTRNLLRNGNLICEFSSIMNAVKNTGSSKGKISRCCNENTGNIDEKFKFSFV